MGTGDYICVTLRGGAPWGFILRQGEGDIYRPLLASQVEDGSRAYLAGVQEDDEVVSINGEPCADLTLLQALALIETSTITLQLLLKRCNFLPPGDSDSEGTSLGENVSSDENLKSTTLHIISPKSEIPREVHISDPQGKVLYRELDSDTEALPRGKLSDDLGGHELAFTHNKEVRRCCSTGEFVELQVSLSDQTLAYGGCTSLGSARGIEGDFSAIDPVHTTSSHHAQCPVREPLGQHGVVVRAPTVEGTLQPPDASGTGRSTLSVGGPTTTENTGSQSEEEEGGGPSQPVPASFTVSFEIPSDKATLAEEQEDSESEGDQEKPNKHRAKHARLRRNESLSEKQVKEAKSKCKRIALLLSAAPSNPNNKGVLMFKKHRQRAKKYTLVSYGTGEDEPDFSDEEDDVNDDDKQEIPPGEISFEAAIDCESNRPFLLNVPGSKGVLTFKLGKSLVEINNNLNNQAEMECFPETKGKGAAMFAQRRQRMDEITAEHEELRRQGLPVEAVQELEKKVTGQSYIQSATEGHGYLDVNMHQQNQQQYQQYQEQQYYEQQQNYQQQQQYQQYQQQQYEQQYKQQQLYQQQQQYHQEHQQIQQYSTNINGTIQHQTNEIQSSFNNRTAKPFTTENMVATPYSHGASGTSQDSVGQGEQIASRDERISTPAIRTGLLSDSRRKSTGKPMFTFKEAPKVSPNPALLNLLNRSDKKGFESGPEEDYLSLGAEACNFLQSQRLKPKIPPPVAPKPLINPNSPPWSAQIEAANQDMPQCAENSLSTPAAAPTTETAPAPELEPAPAPAPEPSTLPSPEETTANPTPAEQHSWTLPDPESQQQPAQVTSQETHGQVISAQHCESSQMATWGSVQVQAHQQSAACSWQSAQVQPQNPPPSQSPPQPPWVTRQSPQSQTQIQLSSNTWTPQGQPSWTPHEEQAQPQTNAQPSWAQPQEQLQSHPQVQPPWTLMKEKQHLQQKQASWSQAQEPVQTQPQNQWMQAPHTDSQQQLPWVQQPQQKPQVQPPWVQQVQPEIQPQPPWVQQVQPETQPQPSWGQQQHHQAFPQAWANAQVPGQPQPPWVSTQPQPQPPANPWPQSQTQAQTQPPWMNAAQVQPQAQAQVNLNPWAPVPAHTPPQTSWAPQTPEHGGDQPINSWAQDQSQAQHQPPWVQSVPSPPTPQSNWQQSLSNTSQQPQLNTWPSAQAQPPTPVNDWRPQLQQSSLNVPLSTVNTQPSPKPWHPPQNQTPPPPPRRMFSYTVGQKAASPVNPMATVLNPKLSPGPAFEMPVVKGKGADMFAKRQSRMEKFVVDSETVEANKASRSTSPAASLPNEWKYTPNATGRGYTLSPPARVPFTGQKSASASSSPKPPTRAFTNPPVRQTSHLDKGFKPLTPWEAASRHPLGLVDEAFAFQDLQQALASNVHFAARRKILPEPPAEWKGRVSYTTQPKPGSQTWSQSHNQGRAPIPSFVSPSRSPASSPVGLQGFRSLPRQWQPQKYQRHSVSSSERPTYTSAYTSNTWSWRR
ncbi:synaptopodin-2 isoform X2 [Poecilia formosa]|uniref:Synaptopodin-2-like n=1 Tax=Poecilia formosa TaxID=48698 RepID=A0A096MAV4_POEFO|nr:PREDICTED: synaptopodin-2-like isoform X2 [Poecilia formosa]XP_016530737.1 PREDICTED: synaptopodin-2-like isoform X2 [Poecilia formosa]